MVKKVAPVKKQQIAKKISKGLANYYRKGVTKTSKRK